MFVYINIIVEVKDNVFFKLNKKHFGTQVEFDIKTNKFMVSYCFCSHLHDEWHI